MVRQKDEFWKYVEQMNPGFKCNFCGRKFRGAGATRIKWHLSGEKGHDIEICTEVPEDVRAAALQATKRPCKKAKTASSSSTVEASRDRASIEVLEGLVPELMQFEADEAIDFETLFSTDVVQPYFPQGDMDPPQEWSNASVVQGLRGFQPESFGPVIRNASVIDPTSSGSSADVCTMTPMLGGFLNVVGGETTPHFPVGFHSIGNVPVTGNVSVIGSPSSRSAETLFDVVQPYFPQGDMDPPQLWSNASVVQGLGASSQNHFVPTFLMPTTLDGSPDETAAHVPGGFQPGRNGETGEMISRKRSADV